MARLAAVTFACEDPERLAAFWADMLRYERESAPAGTVALHDPEGTGPRLRFRRQPKTQTIEVPIHLDVNAADRERQVGRLLGLGARLVGTKTIALGDFSETWTVMRDPEGNGFCVQGPDPRGEERPFIFNVTFACADPPRLGAFWTEAVGYVSKQPDAELLQRLLDAGLDPAELDAYASAVHPDGTPPRLLFQRRQKTPARDLPIRLDLEAADREGEVERLVALGAARAETAGTLTDPEGNAFSLEEATRRR